MFRLGESGDDHSPMQNKREREETGESVVAKEDTTSKKQRNETETSSEALASSLIPTSAASDSIAPTQMNGASSTLSTNESPKQNAGEKEEIKTPEEMEKRTTIQEDDGKTKDCPTQEIVKATTVTQEKAEESTERSNNNSGANLGFGAFASHSAPFKSATALTQKAEDAAVQVDKDWAASSHEKVPENQEIVVRKKEVQRPDLECMYALFNIQ